MENGTKIKVLAAVFLIGFCLSSKGAFAPQILTTNFVQSPPVDGYLLTTLNGFPTFEPPGQPAVIQTNFIAFTTNFYINNNIVSNYFITNVFTVSAISNYFQTFNSFITTNVTVTNTFITNYLTQSTTVVSNLTLQMISTNNYVSNYFQTNIFNSITQVITNSDLWWALNPLTGAITNVNGGGVSVGPGTNGASQVYLLDASGTFVVAGFDTNNHAGWFGPGLYWTSFVNASFPAYNIMPSSNYSGLILFGTNNSPFLIYDSSLTPTNYSEVGAASLDLGLTANGFVEGLNQYSYFPNPATNIIASVLAIQADAVGPTYGGGVLLDPNSDNRRYPFTFSTTITNVIGSSSNIFAIQNAHTNQLTLKGNGVLGVNNFISPTNTPAVSQLLQASSTAGDSKWANVNQIITNTVFDTIYATNIFVTNITSQTSTSVTNIFNVGKGGTLVITNGLTNLNLTASSVVTTDPNKALTTAANAHGVLTNSASGPPSFGLLQNTELVNSSITVNGTANQVNVIGSPVSLGGSVTLSTPQNINVGASPTFNGVNITNLTYQYTTNPITGLNLVYGQALFTNISANITVTLASPANNYFETSVLWVTNSGGTDFKVTFPSGVWGTPGSGTPPAYYCTNKMLTRIMVEHYGNLMTNCYKLDFAP